MRRFLIQAALVVIMASSTVAHADNFTLISPNCYLDDCLPPTIVTFYLPPVPLDYSQVTTATVDGIEFSLQLGFYSPEDTADGSGKLLLLQGGLFGPNGPCGGYCGTFLFFDDLLINDLTPGGWFFIDGTHTGSYALDSGEGLLPSSYPVTLVITPDASTVPEPSSLLLLATGLLGLGVTVSRRSR